MAKKLLSNKSGLAHGTLEAVVCRVPEVALVFDPLSVSTDDLTAFEALLSVQSVVTLHAMRVAITCYIQQPSQIQVAFVTTEVLAMPVTVLSLGVFSTEDQLEQDEKDRVSGLCHEVVAGSPTKYVYLSDNRFSMTWENELQLPFSFSYDIEKRNSNFYFRLSFFYDIETQLCSRDNLPTRTRHDLQAFTVNIRI